MENRPYGHDTREIKDTSIDAVGPLAYKILDMAMYPVIIISLITRQWDAFLYLVML